MLLAAAAVGGGEQGPAVGGDLQGGLQSREGGVVRPEMTGVLWQTGWRRVHGMAEWMWLEPIAEPKNRPLKLFNLQFPAKCRANPLNSDPRKALVLPSSIRKHQI
jgi:hypothetical protein